MKKADIEALMAARIPESRSLDYKERIADFGTDKNAKLDLLNDVAAFANTAGGKIIFGISERRDRHRTTG